MKKQLQKLRVEEPESIIVKMNDFIKTNPLIEHVVSYLEHEAWETEAEVTTLG